MEALWVSAAVVAVAELGDKTQVLSLFLAARYQRVWPVIGGIALASLIHHGLAGALGAVLGEVVPGPALRIAVGLAFLVMAVWSLWPVDEEAEAEAVEVSGRGAFTGTLIAFLIAEIADKTQLATVALAARYDAVGWVVTGSVLGMLVANVPAVLLGRVAAEKLPVRAIRWASAALFAVLGVLALVGWGGE